MNHDEVLALFDRQMRRDSRAEGPSTGMRLDGAVLRHVGADELDWNAVVWSDLDETTADEAIDDQVRFFGERGVGFEWKLYGHDRPADLGDRLIAAGFAAEERETLMVGAVADLRLSTDLPPGVRVERVTDAAGVELMAQASERAFGENADWLRHRVLKQLADDPENAHPFVALAGDEPVSGARMDVYPGTDFVGLWGGGTVPGWRGKGIYRALVAERARIAADLGYKYLQVDATDQSRPILQRLGFAALSTTTPYLKAAPVK
ncbi:MAG TPA: GNAT family N-acetyltransferase [Actinoplanes sp.]|nr:GNAT family N-acetyltransferase [Actinoplanes sp.]